MLVNGHCAIQLIYDLLLSRKWLVTEAEKLPLDPISEKDAVIFLYTLEQQNKETWLQLTPNQRATANGLLMDFIGKCLVTSKEWVVTDNIAPEQQAIEIIKQEIKRSHPQFLTLQ